MRFLLISTKISGIKNIAEEITIQFVNKLFRDSMLDSGHIKAIYGPNGSGKSGICHAYDLYRQIVAQESALKNPLIVASLRKLVNKKTKTFSIENTFACSFEGEETVLYSHRLCVSVASNIPLVAEESLQCIDKRGNKRYLFFHLKDGKVIDTDYDFALSSSDTAFLRYGSCIPYLRIGNGPLRKNGKANRIASVVYLFALSLYVKYGSQVDTHPAFFAKEVADIQSVKDIATLDSSMLFGAPSDEAYYWSGPVSEEGEVRAVVRRMVPFLQTINDAILDVEPEFRREDEKHSHALLRFLYDGYSVDFEFESTGIQKAVRMFDLFMCASRGGIAIIDEIDAGLHDVFLTKLIEFFALYGEGQIIMTTHNVQLMKPIKSLPKSIDFLTYDNMLVPWLQKGSASPSKAYLQGSIAHLPFNLKPADFGPIFYGEANDD